MVTSYLSSPSLGTLAQPLTGPSLSPVSVPNRTLEVCEFRKLEPPLQSETGSQTTV